MKKIKRLLLTIVVASSCLALISVSVKAEPYQDKKFSFAQPDKSMVDVIGTGDEFFQHIESEDGYTLTRNDEGFICYAKLNDDGTELEATDAVYTGENDNVPEGLQKHLDITQESIDKKTKEAREKSGVKDECGLDKMVKSKTRSLVKEDKQKVVGLTVLIDFPDEESTVSYDDVEDFLNKKGYTGFKNNGSVHDFFDDISNGEVDYTNKILKCSEENKLYFRAEHEKSFYDSKDKTDTEAAELLIGEVNEWLEKNKDKIDLSEVSRNEDGTFTILNLFYAGKPTQGYMKGLWPHKANVGNQVYEITNIGDELSLGVICHETAHALLGYHDMYHYTKTKEEGKSGPLMIGPYCLMANGGDNENGKNPAPPNPYLRYVISGFKGNVTNLESVNYGDTLSLKSSDKGFGDVYKLTNPRDDGECLLIENIQKRGRYKGVPDSGLAVWHANLDSYEGYVSMIYANNPQICSGGSLFSAETVNEANRLVTPNAKWDGINEEEREYSELNIYNVSKNSEEMTFQKGCTLKPGLYTSDGKIFDIIDDKGETAEGFKTIGSKTYYFYKFSRNAALGLTKIDKDTYYFDETTGEMKTGFIKVGDKEYFFNNDKDDSNNYGKMAKGWFIDKNTGKKYYIGYYGIAKGLEVVYGDENTPARTYYFDQDGVYNPDKKGFVFVGDYKTLDNTDYYLDCKNQVEMGQKINFEAGMIGDLGDYDFKFTTSYRAVPGPAEEYNCSPYAFARYEFTPKHTGYCIVTVTATDRHTHETYTESITLDISPELDIDYIMANDEKVDVKKGAIGNVDEEVVLKAAVKGGYQYDNTYKYSCEVRRFDYDNNEIKEDKKVYDNLTSPEIKLTPEEEGIYKIKFKVEDALGTVAEKEIEYGV